MESRRETIARSMWFEEEDEDEDELWDDDELEDELEWLLEEDEL